MERLFRSPWFSLARAVVFAEALCLGVYFLLPETLSSAPRGVIGVPTFTNQNILARFWLFYSQVLLVPLGVFLFFRGEIPLRVAEPKALSLAGGELLRSWLVGTNGPLFSSKYFFSAPAIPYLFFGSPNGRVGKSHG